MCVFLCANPQVRSWLDMEVARAARQTLQLSAICPADPYSSDDKGSDEPRCAAQEAQVVRRRLAMPFRRRQPGVDRLGAARCGSANEWHKPLDALANAWSRLLLLVGWRR
jgi:hypothetical protein